MPSEQQLFELRRVRPDTPEFEGIEFIEVEAKTVINHVPGDALPFSWTINPYRGCTHACVYCLSGDTSILMGNGRTKAIADVRAGDAVYGTVKRGAYRRYAVTRVLAQWATVKPAYRVTLQDGTMLVSSGDHRFLTHRGWKHVTGHVTGRDRRPHLTLNNTLLGTGRFAAPPQECAEYRRGYLCGMIRGDGHLASYRYHRPGRHTDDVHRFRLALTDLEGLQRTRRYLRGFAVETDEFAFAAGGEGRRAMRAIRTSKGANIAAITEMIAWPPDPSDDWRKGFLAGIFDAEGCHSWGILRIANTDAQILDRITSCADRLGFSWTLERQQGRVANVRLMGGLREHLRFFHTVDPAITRKRTIEGTAIKNGTRLRVVGIEPLGLNLAMFDITTETGDFIANGVVSHNCFARPTHNFLDMDAGRDFERKIVVKVNAPQVLRRQLGARRWKGEHIAMGTNTDPYQRAEGRYRLMPEIIQALTDYRNPFSILTKGTLLLRDVDLLIQAARVAEVSTAFSIGTLDEEAWRRTEPGTPHPRKRMEVVAALNEAGIPCGVLIAPVLPGITDDPRQLREVVRAAIDAGATHVSPILLHLRPGVREEFMPWLAENHPDLVPRYEWMYRRAYAPSADRKALGTRVASIRRALGGMRLPNETPGRWRRDSADPPEPPAGAQQLTIV